MKKFIAAGAALAFVLAALPASAAITVTNSATASITNSLAASAQTGNNIAIGNTTAAMLSGANISGSVGGSFTGFGASSLMGGDATIMSGDASAGVSAQNSVNSSDVDVDTEPWVDVTVASLGAASLTNNLAGAVHTGVNTAQPGVSTLDISGGNLSGSGWGNHSGVGGTSVTGGTSAVTTGNTASVASAINLLNSSIVRVR